MRIGIRTQFISAFVGIILVVAILLTIVSTIVLSRTLSSQLVDRTAQVARVVEGELALRRRNVEHLVELHTTNEQVRNEVRLQSWPDVGKRLDDFRAERHIDVALVFDSDGVVQVASGIPLEKASPFAAAHGRAKLDRGVPQSLIEPITDAHGGAMYIVAAETVEDYGNIRGEVVLFQKITDAIAGDVQAKVGAQVVLFDAAGPLASSLKLTPPVAEKIKDAFPELAKQKIVTIGSFQNGDVSFFAEAVPLSDSPNPRVGTVAPRAGVAFAIPQTEIVVAQRRTLLSSLIPAVLMTIIAGLLALTLANTIARPIAAMAEQFSRISASGDLSLRVREDTNNEIGDMARSFNGMQERVEQLHGRVAQAEERMRKELQMASTVQEMLFQQEMPHNAACDVAAYTSTLVETSGDWYAVFDDPDAKRTVFVIADATGHGAAAALLTAITHGFFQTMKTAKQGGTDALSRIPPSQILSMLNSVVLNSAHGTITATVFVGVLHHGTRKMVYASAGHIPPIVTRWIDGEMKANILSCNPSSSIGSSEKPIYEDYTVELPADGLVIVYTDGLTEVENPQGLQWGVRKLIGVLRGCERDTVEAVRQKLLDSCMAFARGKELQDDMTYLTIRVR